MKNWLFSHATDCQAKLTSAAWAGTKLGADQLILDYTGMQYYFMEFPGM